jgi:hypothetical protein
VAIAPDRYLADIQPVTKVVKSDRRALVIQDLGFYCEFIKANPLERLYKIISYWHKRLVYLKGSSTFVW